jgi:hypothetical protein
LKAVFFFFQKFSQHYDTDDDSPMSIVASAAERKKLLEEVESIFHAPLPAEPNYDEVDLIIGERRQRVRRRAALGTVSRCCKHVRWNERVRVLGESDNMVVLCSDCDHVSTAGSDAESNDEKLADVGTDSLHQAGPPGFDDHGLEAMRVSVEPDILEGTKNFSYLHYTLGRYVRFFFARLSEICCQLRGIYSIGYM